MCPGKAEDSGFVVHQLRKSLHRAAAVDGQRNSGIVAGRQHQSIQQLLKGQHFPLLQVHGRTLDANRFLRNPHSVQHIALFTDNQCRHDFRRAGNQASLLCIPREQLPAADGVQNIRPARGNRFRLHRNQQSDGQQRSRRSGEESFHVSHPELVCPDVRWVIPPFFPLFCHPTERSAFPVYPASFPRCGRPWNWQAQGRASYAHFRPARSGSTGALP